MSRVVAAVLALIVAAPAVSWGGACEPEDVDLVAAEACCCPQDDPDSSETTLERACCCSLRDAAPSVEAQPATAETHVEISVALARSGAAAVTPRAPASPHVVALDRSARAPPTARSLLAQHTSLLL